MPNSGHTIRLNGPWNISLRQNEQAIYAGKLSFTRAEPWPKSITNKLTNESLCQQLENTIQLRLQRSFNWPSSMDSSILLCVESTQPLRAELNDTSLIETPDSEKLRQFEIQPLVQNFNRLTLTWDDWDLTDLANCVAGVHLLAY